MSGSRSAQLYPSHLGVCSVVAGSAGVVTVSSSVRVVRVHVPVESTHDQRSSGPLVVESVR